MIYFVGAGPGAADLITVRGQRLLERADVIVYAGSLVNPALLESAAPRCAIYDSAGMTLEEVTDVLIRADKGGKTAVRLHTGDPSLYGAVREQMDILSRQGAAFESVPGVSSFCGAAAALQAEYTLPEVSQTVIITRTAGRTPVPEKESVAALAAHRATMVIFLSAGMTEKVKEELLAGGYPASTPAAIVFKATWPEEKIVRGTVGRLPEMAKEHGIYKTALILIGEFLGDSYGRSMLYNPAFSHQFRKGR